jgi:hypothetical protein
MTNELDYYGRPEPFGRTLSGRKNSVAQQRPKTFPDSPSENGHFFKLHEGDAVRLARTRGLRDGASFLGLAVHANAGRKCFPKVPTVARVTGLSTRSTSNGLRRLDADGFIKIQRRKRESSMYAVAYSDTPKQRYAQISKSWLEAHCDLGPSALFLLAVLLAMAGPRRTFSRRLDDLIRALGLPRSTFYRLAGKIKQHGCLDWRCADGSIELTMLENPVPKTAVLPVSKPAVLAVSKTAMEVATASEVARVSEVARSESTPTQDQHRAKICANAAASAPICSDSQDRKTPATWVPVIRGTTVFGAYMFDVFWMAIEAQIGVPRQQIHPELIRRVNGLLRARGVVVRAGLERFEAALAHAIHDRKERGADGIKTGAALLDVIGKAVQDLGCDLGIETGDIGHAEGTTCPMAVYESMCA